MQLPSIGALNRRLVIQQRTDSATGDFTTQESYTPVATVWASIDPVGGGSYWGSKQTETMVTHRIMIRRWPGMTDPEKISGEYVIDCEGLRYRPHRISDANGRKRFTVIEAEQLGSIA